MQITDRVVRGILLLAVIGVVLAVSPGNVEGQIWGKLTNGTDIFLEDYMDSALENNLNLRHVTVYSYVTKSAIKGTVTRIEEKGVLNYVLPEISTGAKAGLEAGIKGKNPEATLGASAHFTATWDLSPPQPTIEQYDLIREESRNGTLVHNGGIIEEVYVRGFGKIDAGELDVRTGILHNNSHITSAAINEYGRANNNKGAWIGTAFVGLSGEDIYDHERNLIDKNAIENAAVLANMSNIDVAVVQRGGHLENQGFSGGEYLPTHITQANIVDGSLTNTYGATIGAAIISGGLVLNDKSAVIDSLVMTGGTLNNNGGIINNTIFVEAGENENGTVPVNIGRGKDGGKGGTGITGGGIDSNSDGIEDGIGSKGSDANESIYSIVNNTVDVRGILYNGVGGTGGMGGTGGTGNKGGAGNEKGGTGGVGGLGGESTSSLGTVILREGSTLYNGVGGDGGVGGTGGTGGNGQNSQGLNNGTSASDDAGVGGKGSVGSSGEGLIYTVDIGKGATLYNGKGGNGGVGGNGGNGGDTGRDDTFFGAPIWGGHGGQGGFGGQGGNGGDGEGTIYYCDNKRRRNVI